MEWDEFTSLLCGINGDTPLGNVVRIRSEKDHKKIKDFSPEEKRIYNEWKSRRLRTITATAEEGERVLRALFVN